MNPYKLKGVIWYTAKDTSFSEETGGEGGAGVLPYMLWNIHI